MMKNVSILVAAFGASITLWGCKDTFQDDMKQCMDTATSAYGSATDLAGCQAATDAYVKCIKGVYENHKGEFQEETIDMTTGEIQQEWIDKHGALKEPYANMIKARGECKTKNTGNGQNAPSTGTLEVKTEAHADTKKADPTSLAELEVHQQKLGGKHSSHKHTHAHVTVEVPADGHARQIPEPKA